MQNIKIITIAIIMGLLTLCICVNKPQMHKQAIVTGEEKTFITEEFQPTKIQATTKTIAPIQQPIKTNSTKIKTTNTNITPQKQSTVQKQNKITEKKTTSKPNLTVKTNQANSTQNKTVEQTQIPPKKVEKKEPPIANTETEKILTEYEETIAWNKWRSDLQNQVMKDTKIIAPLGTGFKFSFTVDKFGNMSNVNVWSTNPTYTDLANRVIKPVLMSYQKKSILKFPEGTKRIITNVNGGFVISHTTEYSKPSDYSDYETIKRSK